MGVITETEPGGEIVCVLEFSARPRDADRRPASEKRRTFRVGQRVRYVGFFDKRSPEDNPTGRMIVFEPLDPRDRNQYAATQGYFVTDECWEGIARHFARSLVVAEQAATARPGGTASRKPSGTVPNASARPQPGRSVARTPKPSAR